MDEQLAALHRLTSTLGIADSTIAVMAVRHGPTLFTLNCMR